MFYPDVVARQRFDIPSLKKIWEWSDRVVFDLGDDKVLKVSKTTRWLYQNAWADAYLAREWVIPDLSWLGNR